MYVGKFGMKVSGRVGQRFNEDDRDYRVYDLTWTLNQNERDD